MFISRKEFEAILARISTVEVNLKRVAELHKDDKLRWNGDALFHISHDKVFEDVKAVLSAILKTEVQKELSGADRAKKKDNITAVDRQIEESSGIPAPEVAWLRESIKTSILDALKKNKAERKKK
jgi:hypothetical protein